jgi:3-deoxy-manno-octulosonate cytidylyltransferase (CMP-KDO synthetase)
MRILGVIPARFGSTRFPGKPLADIAGKTLIQRVIERAKLAQGLADVWVATDDSRIFEHLESLGYHVVMTSIDHPTGTDRLAEVAAKHTGYDAYLNIQGDEPLIDPAQIDLLAEAFSLRPDVEIATLVHPLTQEADLDNPNVVKVVRNSAEFALYFSRSPIPYLRNALPSLTRAEQHPYWKHVGLYGFTPIALKLVAALEMGSLEQAESLEQLRWLEAGLSIYTRVTHTQTQPVDVPEDIDKVLAMMG